MLAAIAFAWLRLAVLGTCSEAADYPAPADWQAYGFAVWRDCAIPYPTAATVASSERIR